MALYLKAKKMDLELGDKVAIILNEKQSGSFGVKEGQKVFFAYRDIELYVDVIETSTKIKEGYVGLTGEIWSRYAIPNDEIVVIDLLERPVSIDYIKKKLFGEKLNEEEIFEITKDVAERKIRDIEVAYFMSCFFNPGFNDDEIISIAKGMANAGDTLNFHDYKGNGKTVVDKHSIGGVAGKGITPILVPIIASAGLVIPNTSTRSITTPAGTTDVLETIMPVTFTNDQVLDIVKKNNGCMIWGGGLKLAPADDVMISVEKSMHAQSYNKLIASIVAKKIAMGIDKVVIDIPYGKGAKVKNADEAELLGRRFEEIFGCVGIDCFSMTRFICGPDGNGVGPALEMIEILKVFERDESRSFQLENDALQLAGKLLEMGGKAKIGKGKEMAYAILESGKAFEKFKNIAISQGAVSIPRSSDILPGEYKADLHAHKSGIVKFIDNKEIVNIAKSLGAPLSKGAGIYFHKNVGQKILFDEKICTVYAESKDRLELGKAGIDLEKLFDIRVV